MKKIAVIILSCIITTAFITCSFAMGRQTDKKAIVLASFGTTYPSALRAITNIRGEVKKAFPGVKVRVAFTSNIIRRIWHKRRGDKEFFLKHRNISKSMTHIKGPLATIADLQDEGYRTIIVQPTHIYAGEEYVDLCSYVRGLNSIETIKRKYMPFNKLVIGRPVLGKWGPTHDYHEDLEIAAQALASDVQFAREKGAALVYMGHGNEFFSTGIYIEFQQVMRKMYPEVHTYVGTVEGFPSLEDVVFGLTHARVKAVVLKPFMIVAGDHARNDMAGDDKDSWKNVISAKGIKVFPVIHGLGEKDEIANIIVQHIRDVAKDNGIGL